MNDDFVDTEQLIEEIKKYPGIWNVSCEDYKDRNKKMSCWLEVCRSMYEDYGEQSDSEKMIIERKMMNRWKNVRDNFLRSEKKHRLGQVSSMGRRYIFAKHLSFLTEANENEATTSSSMDGEIIIADLTPQLTPEMEDVKPRKRTRHLTTPYPVVSYLTPSNVSTDIRTCEEGNEDKQYFDSLLPLIKDFTLDQRIEFRLKVLTIIKDIRNS